MHMTTLEIRAYLSLTKPGIVFGNAITCFGGFALASQRHFDFWLLFITLIGLCAIVAAGCVSNNYIDRYHDKKMQRTKNRALVTGLIAPQNALLFAMALVLLGSFVLLVYVNLLSLLVSLFGLFVYLVFYSFLKYHSIHGTLIGSLAGAVPPVVGYCSVSNHFDLAALLLFLMIAMWQMPHFYAIAIYRLEDYVSAEIPVLPLKKGVLTTKIHMLSYIMMFTVISSILFVLGYVSNLYLIVVTLLGCTWLWLCIQEVSRHSNTKV